MVTMKVVHAYVQPHAEHLHKLLNNFSQQSLKRSADKVIHLFHDNAKVMMKNMHV